MSERPPEEAEQPERKDLSEYTGINLESEYIVFDKSNGRTFVQSSRYIDVTEYR